jgi:DNA-binding HxlR family transcriptional regulator
VILLNAINEQASLGRRLGWQVLIDTLRRLEEQGYVGHMEISPPPARETRYWLRPPATRLLSALNTLDAWV